MKKFDLQDGELRQEADEIARLEAHAVASGEATRAEADKPYEKSINRRNLQELERREGPATLREKRDLAQRNARRRPKRKSAFAGSP